MLHRKIICKFYTLIVLELAQKNHKPCDIFLSEVDEYVERKLLQFALIFPQLAAHLAAHLAAQLCL
jgi:hypothetical protein